MKKIIAVLIVVFVVVSFLIAGAVMADDGEKGKWERHPEKEAEGLLPIERMGDGVVGETQVAPPPQTPPPFAVTEEVLTVGLGEAKSPAWSPNGQVIVFQTRAVLDNYWQIGIINADGTGETRLTDNDCCDTSPIFTPDGSKIIFARNEDPEELAGNDHAGIWMMNPDGSDQVEVSPTGDTTCRGKPISVSPDGAKVLYKYDDDDLYELVIATGVETELVDGGGYPPDNPKYSIGGSQIIYRDTSYYLHVMDADGSNDSYLEDDYVKWFDWSPDGSKVVFTHNDDTPYGLCLINPDETGFEFILESDDYCAAAPDWSPTGEWITFVYGPTGDGSSSGGEDSDIRIISPDGSEQYSLTDTFDRDDGDPYPNPTFSPDGGRIVFTQGYPNEIVLISGISGLPPVRVGGEVQPLDKLAITAPWIGLAVLLVGGLTWFTLRRRQAR